METESIVCRPAVARVNPFPDIKHLDEQKSPKIKNEMSRKWGNSEK